MGFLKLLLQLSDFILFYHQICLKHLILGDQICDLDLKSFDARIVLIFVHGQLFFENLYLSLADQTLFAGVRTRFEQINACVN